jgi:hypothetical protein
MRVNAHRRKNGRRSGRAYRMAANGVAVRRGRSTDALLRVLLLQVVRGDALGKTGAFKIRHAATRDSSGRKITRNCQTAISCNLRGFFSANMNQEKYIGMDLHQATISVAVRDSSGNLIMECILETLSGHPKPANEGHLKTGQRE